MYDYARLRDRIASARELGFRAALDNLGEGYSGFDKLVELEPEYIKLHGSIVADCHLSSVKREMIRTVRVMADKMDAHLIAHGVKKSEELQCLRELGIPLGQGFLFGRPGVGALSATHV